MKKLLQYFLFIFISLNLASCSVTETPAPVADSENISTITNVHDVIEQDDISQDNDENVNIPLYQRLDNKTKKVKVYRKIIKPLTDVRPNPYRLSDDEFNKVIELLDDKDEFISGKTYEEKSLNRLIENYKNIKKTSETCCSYSIIKGLATKGKQTGYMYDMLLSDLKNKNVQENCILLPDSAIEREFGSSDAADKIITIKNNCICNNKAFLQENVNTFLEIEEAGGNIDIDYITKSASGKKIKQNISDTIHDLNKVLNNCQ